MRWLLAAILICLCSCEAVYATSVDPSATTATNNVLTYLTNLSNSSATTNKLISGQYTESTSTYNASNCSNGLVSCNDFAGVYNNTGGASGGVYPGMMMIDWTFASTYPVQTLINHWNAGGLVQVGTHINNPTTNGNAWDLSTVNFTALMQAGTTENTRLNTWLSGLADKFTTLQTAGVPVLFRPLHEMNGGWFWWNTIGTTNYKALWNYVVNYMNSTRGLHNIIWVWSPDSGLNSSWYPGTSKVDVVSVDLYGSSSPSAVSGYSELTSTYSSKPFMLGEWGACPGGSDYYQNTGSCPKVDMNNFVNAIKNNMPRAVAWQAWNNIYSMAYHSNLTAALKTNAWVVNRDELPSFSGTGDTTDPTVTITTGNSTITANSLAISGSAYDDVGLSSCKYRIGAAPDSSNGTAVTGTATWSATVTGFASGANTLYVGCRDAAENWGSNSITVTYSPSVSSNIIFEDNFDSTTWNVDGTKDDTDCGGSDIPCTGVKIPPTGWTGYRANAPVSGRKLSITTPPTGNDHTTNSASGKVLVVKYPTTAYSGDSLLGKLLSTSIQYDELYIQFWFRWETPAPGVVDAGMKFFRVAKYDTDYTNFFEFDSQGSAGPVNYFNINQGYPNDTSHGGYTLHYRCDPQASYFTCSPAPVYDGVKLNWPGGGSIATTWGNGSWHRIKLRVKMNDPGVLNGHQQTWIDGVEVNNLTNVSWTESGTDATGWNAIYLGGNTSGNSKESWALFDDIVVSTSDIADDYVPGMSSGQGYTPATTPKRPAGCTILDKIIWQ